MSAKEFVIGILGEELIFTLSYIANIRLALQGAFVEHQTALESLSFQEKLEVILVKTPEGLQKCDALVIPGGG